MKKIWIKTNLQNFAEGKEPENKETENKEPEKKIDENVKDFSKNENNDYNNNKEELKEKSLEEEINDVKDKKLLAKTIVDMKEETAEIKTMLSKIANILNTKSNSFTDSKVNDSNSNDNKYIFYVKD